MLFQPRPVFGEVEGEIRQKFGQGEKIRADIAQPQRGFVRGGKGKMGQSVHVRTFTRTAPGVQF